MSRGVSSREALNPDSATDREQIERKPARFGELSRDRVESSTVAWGVLAVALVAAAGLLYHLTRGTTFWFDEWLWITGRRGNDAGTFLHPYNEHLSLVPIVLYRLLFATAGIRTYVPYRVMVIAGHLACVLLVYLYARRRVGEYLALLGALLILFLGPAWQNILWPFQVAWLIAIATGIGALSMLDRRDRLGDVAACTLLTVSLASTSLGIAIALGAAVDVAWGRRKWGDAWIVAVPLLLYGLWSLAFQHANIVANDVFLVEQFVATSAAASLTALLGLFEQGANADIAFGAPLALAAVAVLVWLAYRRRWSARSASLATVLLVFWILTAIGRGFLGGSAASSRYLYVDCVLVVLLAAELGRGMTVTLRAGVPLTLLTAAAIVSNIGILRANAAYLRTAAQQAKAELGALNLSRSFIGPDYVATSFPGYPFIPIQAGKLFAAERSLGSPGDSPAQLVTAPEDARERADAEIVRAERVALAPTPTRPALGPAPSVDLVSAGAAGPVGSCIAFHPGIAVAGQSAQLQLMIRSGGLWLLPSSAEATVGVRRFAGTFQPLGTLPSNVSAAVRIRPDRAAAPWHLQLVTSGRATVCGLAG